MKTTEVRALPAAVDLQTAARAFGLSRTTAYAMARRGEFPVPLLRLGSQYRATRADILRALGISETA